MLAAIRRGIDQFFELGADLRTVGRAEFGKEGFEFSEEDEVFAIGVAKEVEIDGMVIHQGCCHIPIARDHAQVAAVLTSQSLINFGEGGGMEVVEIPGARFAHGFFAAQLVELQYEAGLFLY